MKIAAFITALVLVSGAYGQEALPNGVQPSNLSGTFSYKPAFQGACTIKLGARNSSSWGWTRNETGVLTAVSEVAKDKHVYSVLIADKRDNSEMRMSFALGDNGGSFVSEKIESRSYPGAVWAEAPLYVKRQDEPASDRDIPYQVWQALLALHDSDLSTKFIGQSLAQGGSIKAAICPGSAPSSVVGGFSVIGKTQLSGRSVLIVAGEASEECYFDGHNVAVTDKGWAAIDVHSGLLVKQSTKRVLKSQNKMFEGESSDDRSCVISGSPVVAQRPSDAPSVSSPSINPSVAQRLKELKELKDQGLITQDQFEKKSAEILKAL